MFAALWHWRQPVGEIASLDDGLPQSRGQTVPRATVRIARGYSSIRLSTRVTRVVICIGLKHANPVASARTIPGGSQLPGTADCRALRTGLIRAREARRQILVAPDVFGPPRVFADWPRASDCRRSEVGDSQIFGFDAFRHPVVQCRQTVI